MLIKPWYDTNCLRRQFSHDTDITWTLSDIKQTSPAPISILWLWQCSAMQIIFLFRICWMWDYHRLRGEWRVHGWCTLPLQKWKMRNRTPSLWWMQDHQRMRGEWQVHGWWFLRLQKWKIRPNVEMGLILENISIEIKRISCASKLVDLYGSH